MLRGWKHPIYVFGFFQVPCNTTLECNWACVQTYLEISDSGWFPGMCPLVDVSRYRALAPRMPYLSKDKLTYPYMSQVVLKSELPNSTQGTSTSNLRNESVNSAFYRHCLVPNWVEVSSWATRTASTRGSIEVEKEGDSDE